MEPPDPLPNSEVKRGSADGNVNESYRVFGVNEHGEIRFGLSAIKGMGAPAADAIVAERLKNGPYKSIFDFAERVDYSSVNRKAFETLALSGGFDSFGIRREQFFGKNNKGETFLDTLVRYGQLFQQEQHEAANSLFGGTEAIEIATPPIPDAESWSTIERLNRERELVGIYLSAHPLVSSGSAVYGGKQEDSGDGTYIQPGGNE